MTTTRALNTTLGEAEVTRRCAAAKISISAIEPLPSGGTHLVCTTIEGADHMRHDLRKHLIEGRVARQPFYVPPSRW